MRRRPFVSFSIMVWIVAGMLAIPGCSRKQPSREAVSQDVSSLPALEQNIIYQTNRTVPAVAPDFSFYASPDESRQEKPEEEFPAVD